VCIKTCLLTKYIMIIILQRLKLKHPSTVYSNFRYCSVYYYYQDSELRTRYFILGTYLHLVIVITNLRFYSIRICIIYNSKPKTYASYFRLFLPNLSDLNGLYTISKGSDREKIWDTLTHRLCRLICILNLILIFKMKIF